MAVPIGLALICLAGSLSARQEPLVPSNTSSIIVPGNVMRDSAGNVIQAHAGCVLQEHGTFYWFGEDRTDGAHFANVNVYESRDLIQWKFDGHALARQGTEDLSENRVVERPKVLFNKRTRTYVMYLHIDDPSYKEAKVGVATSKTITGPYKYRGSFRPLDKESRDMTLFLDDDGVAYLVFEDRGDNGGLQIARLSRDFLSVERIVATVGGRGWYEAPAVIRANGTYYLLGSHLSGWNTNANEYATAASMQGPWSDFADVAPHETKTYNSQTAFILPIQTRKGTRYVYLGDRWKPKNLSDSRYMWLPLTIDDKKIWLPSAGPWVLDH